jgi:hypothetical protein
VAGVSPDSKPPVWCLGLAGSDVLAAFQQAEGTGFGMINWHAKVRYKSAVKTIAVHQCAAAAVFYGCVGVLSQGFRTALLLLLLVSAAAAAVAKLFVAVTLQGIYDYGSPDYMPFWPAGMSGICLGSIINFAFQVLCFLQPTSPAKAVIQNNPNKAIYQPSSTAEPRETLNNARGYWFPYGELKHLPVLEDPVAPPVPASDMACIVNKAISGAAFLGDCWTGVRAAGVECLKQHCR